MPDQRWLPLKHELPSGISLGRLLHGGADWQIYRVDRDNVALVAHLYV